MFSSATKSFVPCPATYTGVYGIVGKHQEVSFDFASGRVTSFIACVILVVGRAFHDDPYKQPNSVSQPHDYMRPRRSGDHLQVYLMHADLLTSYQCTSYPDLKRRSTVLKTWAQVVLADGSIAYLICSLVHRAQLITHASQVLATVDTVDDEAV